MSTLAGDGERHGRTGLEVKRRRFDESLGMCPLLFTVPPEVDTDGDSGVLE